MKIAVILENAPDVELDRAVIDVPEDGDQHVAIEQVLNGWLLSVGDTIKIRAA